MNRIFAVLFLFCTVNGWAQQPLLTTQWNQDYPYNQHCPADPYENFKHGYAGCPAVVMGQILNYLRTTQGTRFDDGDHEDSPVAELGKGIYLLQIEGDKYSGTVKFVVK